MEQRGHVGSFVNDTWICQYVDRVRPVNGLFHAEALLDYATPLLFAQVICIVIISRIFHFLLKPLRQSAVSAEILTGIFLGPSFLTNYMPHITKLFPPEGRASLHIISILGLIFHLFVLTLQMDASMIANAGRKAYLIATTGVLLPSVLGGLTFMIARSVMTNLDQMVAKSVINIIGINSLSSFPVIVNVLADLKILNSDIGRLAAKTAAISDIFCFFVFKSFGAFLQSPVELAIDYFICTITFILAIAYVLRPVIEWMTLRKKGEGEMKGEGEPLTEFHFFFVAVCVLLCALCSEVLGQHYSFGPLLLGIVLPDGPPLAVDMEQKIQTFVTRMLLPVSCAIGGLNTNVFAATSDKNSRTLIILIVAITYVGKFSGTFVSAMFCGLPVRDAFCLTLILCCKGIIEVSVYSSMKDSLILDIDSFNIMIISMLVVTGVARFIVSILYDPSRRFRTNRRRTILGSDYDKMRILVCTHSPDNVPTIIKILRACNPRRISPVTVFVLHLMKLTGRASPIYLPHHKLRKLQYRGFRDVHSINAFDLFEQQYLGCVLVQHYIAVAPYRCMHRDICITALDRKTTILILPFHKQWSIDGKVGSVNPAIRDINKSVMDIAPCSVGILIDRGLISGNHAVVTDNSLYHIAILFFGYDDDWEALALSRQMLDNPRVNLLVVLFQYDHFDPEREKDFEYLVKSFECGECTDRVHFKDARVKDGEQTMDAIRTLEDNLDLVIVGRHHDPHSPLVLGLTEWSECPELGVIGDLLSSSDFVFSVLVVVQQPLKKEVGNNKFEQLSNNRSFNSREPQEDEDHDSTN